MVTKALTTTAKMAASTTGLNTVKSLTERKKKELNQESIPWVELKDREVTIASMEGFLRLCREQPMITVIISIIGIEMSEKLGLISNEWASVLQGAVTTMGLAQAFGGGTIGNLAALLSGLGVGSGMYVSGEGGIPTPTGTLSLDELLTYGLPGYNLFKSYIGKG